MIDIIKMADDLYLVAENYDRSTLGGRFKTSLLAEAWTRAKSLGRISITSQTVAREIAEMLDYQLYRDGNQWCCTEPSFVNLQESPAGFGNAPVDAFNGLLRELDEQDSFF